MKKRIDLFKFAKTLRKAYNPKYISSLFNKLPCKIEHLIKVDRSLYCLVLRKKKIVDAYNFKKCGTIELKAGSLYPYDPTKTISQFINEYFELDYNSYKNIINKGCSKCHSHKRIHLHHIIPKSQGGTNDIDNLTPLCYKCHSQIHPHMKTESKPQKKRFIKSRIYHNYGRPLLR